MESKIIYMDQEGYNNYLAEIEKLKENINKNNINKTEAYESAVGDGWHDNFAFEEATREEFRLMSQLKQMQSDLKRIVILEKNKDNSFIDIGDYVNMDIIFAPDDFENMIIHLIGFNDASFEENEVSVNSPIGSAIYQKPNNYEGTYKVNSNTFSFKINSFSKNREDVENKMKNK